MTGSERAAVVPEVISQVADGFGSLTLNRPAAINALNHGMVRMLASALDAWRHDDRVRAVLITGAGERGFCAGGDVRFMAESVRAGRAICALEFLRDEYRLNGAVGRYEKPIVAFLEGTTMGGGIGIGGHADIRVVTERSAVAMPEARIGFAPDVGGSYLLSRALGELGTHLALTASSVMAGDAILAGFADHFVESSRLSQLADALFRDDGLDPGVVVRSFADTPPPSSLTDSIDWIDACYFGDSAVDIVKRLERRPELRARGGGGATIIRQLLPLAVQTSLLALRRAAALPGLDAVLEQEWRTASGLLVSGDFIEGVRAQLIDKDSDPHWEPVQLEDIDGTMVAAILDSQVIEPL